MDVHVADHDAVRTAGEDDADVAVARDLDAVEHDVVDVVAVEGLRGSAELAPLPAGQCRN